MPFNQNIPQATDKLSVSQSDILANFTALAPFGDGYANLTKLVSAPSWTSDNNGIYNLVNNVAATGNTGVAELFIHHQTVDAPSTIPFTASKMSNTAALTSPFDCDSGWAYLANGMLIKWGVHLTTSSGSGAYETIDVNALSGGPQFKRAFQATVTADTAGNAVGNVANYSVIMDGFASRTTGNIRILARNAISPIPPNPVPPGQFNTKVRYVVIGV